MLGLMMANYASDPRAYSRLLDLCKSSAAVHMTHAPSLVLLPAGGQTPITTKVILSSHNFQNTPSDGELENTLQQMWKAGADVAKIATTATDVNDCARLLTLLETSQGKLLP